MDINGRHIRNLSARVFGVAIAISLVVDPHTQQITVIKKLNQWSCERAVSRKAAEKRRFCFAGLPDRR
jgi:hypothetical protein